MHEFAIGENIVRAAVEGFERASPRPRALRAARVVVGGLHQVVPDNLHMAYEVLSRGTPIEGSRLELRHVPVTARCRRCGWSGEITVPLFACGACASGEIDVLTGKELYLENLEVESDDHAEH